MRCRKANSVYRKLTCVGGPWHTLTLMMPETTMYFKLPRWAGRYVMGNWEDVR